MNEKPTIFSPRIVRATLRHCACASANAFCAYRTALGVEFSLPRVDPVVLGNESVV